MDAQLSLTKIVAVMSFQSRKERNGPETVPAATLACKANVPADMLHKFDSQLKASFYRKEVKADEPVQDLSDEARKELAAGDGLSRLKFPRADNVIEWEEQFPEYRAVVDFGAGEDSAIELEEVTADAFVFSLRDGGSMEMKWNIAAHPEQEEAGKLYTLNGSQVTISLIPPGAENHNPGQGDMLGGRK